MNLDISIDGTHADMPESTNSRQLTCVDGGRPPIPHESGTAVVIRLPTASYTIVAPNQNRASEWVSALRANARGIVSC